MVTMSFRPPLVPLFVPGDRPDRFAKAAASGADAVILDIEDAVAPENKEAARRAVASHGLLGIPVVVRINAATTAWFDADLAALADAAISAVMLPKAETAADIAAIHHALGGRPLPVIPLIETARGLAQLQDTLSANGIVAAAFGSLDLALDLGCEPSWDALLLARSQLVLGSRLAGLPAPLDGITPAIDDPAIIQAEARRAADIGFGGKLAIHPRQIDAIRRALLPDKARRVWAATVVAAAEAGGAVRVDGAMVDRPVIERARRILALPERPE